MRVKTLINTITYWLAPQAGVIAALERKGKAQEDLILTVRANRQAILNENAKLQASLHRVTAERDEARHIVATYEAERDQ